MPKDVTISIVTYNSKDCVLKCLESVYANSDGLEIDVCVVDNNSKDDAIACITKQFPEVKVVANSQNVGFAAANNQVLSEFDARYGLILNPDITIMPGALQEMVRFMDETPDAGVTGCKILNPDLSLQYSCRRYPSPLMILFRGLMLDRFFPDSLLVRRYLMMDWSHDRVMPVDWLTGCCLMVRKETVAKVGLMDERFFLYFEDVDFCYRINKLWKIYYLPHVSMIHEYQHMSRSLGNFKQKFQHMRSAFHFFKKTYFNNNNDKVKNSFGEYHA